MSHLTHFYVDSELSGNPVLFLNDFYKSFKVILFELALNTVYYQKFVSVIKIFVTSPNLFLLLTFSLYHVKITHNTVLLK